MDTFHKDVKPIFRYNLSEAVKKIAELQDKLHRRNVQIKDLKSKQTKALEAIRKAGFIIQDKGNPVEHYLTEANNYLI